MQRARAHGRLEQSHARAMDAKDRRCSVALGVHNGAAAHVDGYQYYITSGWRAPSSTTKPCYDAFELPTAVRAVRCFSPTCCSPAPALIAAPARATAEVAQWGVLVLDCSAAGGSVGSAVRRSSHRALAASPRALAFAPPPTTTTKLTQVIKEVLIRLWQHAGR